MFIPYDFDLFILGVDLLVCFIITFMVFLIEHLSKKYMLIRNLENDYDIIKHLYYIMMVTNALAIVILIASILDIK